MSGQLNVIKHKLAEAITQLCEVSWMFVKKPGQDFTRKRKLSFEKMVSFLLAMEGGSLTTELLKYFGCSVDVATSLAFVQQRGKIDPSAFSALFDLFVQKTDKEKYYKGLRLIAADGSDIHIPTNPNDPESYFPPKENQCVFNLLHLDAMYDLLQHSYIDAILVGQRKANERNSLCDMVDRSALKLFLLLQTEGTRGLILWRTFRKRNGIS